MKRGESDDARPHQAPDLAHRLVAPVPDRLPAHVYEPKCGHLHEQVQHRAGDDAESQHAHVVRDQRADDDCRVVEHRRERGGEEMMARVQDAHEHAADGEQHGRDHHDPGQVDGQRREFLMLAGLTAEAGRRKRHEERREEQTEQGEKERRDEEQVQHRGRQTPAVPLLSLADDARERRDEGAAERRAREQLEDEVGDTKCDEVGVDIRACAELVRDGDRPHEPEQAAAEKSEGDDRRRRGEARRSRVSRHIRRPRGFVCEETGFRSALHSDSSQQTARVWLRMCRSILWAYGTVITAPLAPSL